jgi:SAM-dependent methyltransferase
MSDPASDSRERWNARYLAGEHAGPSPSRIFTDLERFLPTPGRGLDVAGGVGRHAIWLAQRGWQMTVADISPVALAMAQERARDAGVTLQPMERDLERLGVPPGSWDLIVCFHFLWRPLLQQVAAALSERGRIVVVQPTRKNLERHPRPGPAFLLEEGELRQILAPLAIVHYEETWTSEGRHEAIAVAAKSQGNQ